MHGENADFEVGGCGLETLDRTAFGCRSALRLRLIVVLNEKLLEVMGDDVTQTFAHANDVLKNVVGGISAIIHIPGAGRQPTSRTSRR